MQRRRFLAGSAAGLAGGVAGCLSDVSPGSGEQRHPLADATATVRIDNLSRTDHDVEQNGQEALEFWAENAEQYTGFDVDFEVVTEGEADIVIEYVDDPSPCQAVENYSENVLGCAPLVRPQNRLPEPATAIVVAAARPFGKIRITTKHELGHILGLDHDDAPTEIMSNRPEDRIPLYDLRIDIWESVNDGQAQVTEANSRFNGGISVWNDGEYGTAAVEFQSSNEAYTMARERFEAALTMADEFEGHPRVETVALENLRTHLDQLVRRMTAAKGFSGRMADASREAADGNSARANELLSEANEFIRAFNDIGSPELRDIAVALGLVRGFDRDEEIADLDDKQREEP